MPDEQDKDLKPDQLTTQDVEKWLNRVKIAARFHRRELIPKYRIAKRRYNSEIGFNATFRTKARHDDINLLFKDIRDFIGSIFHRNPQIDLTSRDDRPEAITNIENLEQLTNDDIKDDQALKGILRSMLIDENLAGLGGLYIDYDYRDRDLVDGQGQIVPIMGAAEGGEQPILGDDQQPLAKRDVISNKVLVSKILPENIIRPPWIKQYNFMTGPYLGYVDIVQLDTLRADVTLNQEVVKRIKGQVFKALQDTDLKDLEQKGESSTGTTEMDDILHAKVYYVFIRGEDDKPLKRLVIAEDDQVRGEALGYEDWDKGHGKDGRGFPIHVLMLNDAADTFLPPSEAWILESILQIIDYIFQKMNRHLRKSSTKTFYKEGKGGIKKAQMDKIIQNINQQVIGIQNLPEGLDLRGIIHQVTDQPLGQDHAQMFELARQIFDSLSRQPSFAQAQVINKKKTARETEAIEGADTTENGDYIDKLRDFLIGVFVDWARLVQRNFQSTRSISVEEPETGVKNVREVNVEKMQGEFTADINVNSFLPPNKNIKRQILKQALADLTVFEPGLRKTGNQINWKKAVLEYVTNIEMRNPQDMVTPKPIRDIDQQVLDLVFKGIPFNPEELGKDFDESLQRLMEIFSDGVMMNEFEKVRPGVSGPDGEIVKMLQLLVQIVQSQGKPRQQSKQRIAGAETPRPTTQNTGV